MGTSRYREELLHVVQAQIVIGYLGIIQSHDSIEASEDTTYVTEIERLIQQPQRNATEQHP